MKKIEKGILLFDGICNLCTWLAEMIRRKDHGKHIQLIALQSVDGLEFLNMLKVRGQDLQSVIYIRDGKNYHRSAAIIHLLSDLGGMWRLCFLFMVVPPFLRDGLYTLIARWRYRLFGKRDSCSI